MIPIDIQVSRSKVKVKGQAYYTYVGEGGISVLQTSIFSFSVPEGSCRSPDGTKSGIQGWWDGLSPNWTDVDQCSLYEIPGGIQWMKYFSPANMSQPDEVTGYWFVSTYVWYILGAKILLLSQCDGMNVFINSAYKLWYVCWVIVNRDSYIYANKKLFTRLRHDLSTNYWY